MMAILKLYPFQEEALKKLLKVPHVLNGDDMGLGKTIQAIVLDIERRRVTPQAPGERRRMTLIVSPASVISVWSEHFARYTKARVITIDPKKRHLFEAAIRRKTHDVYICHWESLRLMKSPQTVEWFHVIADEAHRAKNRKAQQTQALKKIPAKHKTALTGTPADNKPQDLWSILNWLYPREWSSYWRFFRHYVVFREKFTPRGAVYREICGVANVEELHERMAPFFVRRLKEEVLPDLPEKYYTTYWVDLTPQQRKAYDSMRKDMLAWVGEHEHEPIAAPVVIAQLTRLQQFACAFAEVEQIVRKRKERHKNPLTGEIESVWVEKQLRRVKLTEPSAKLDLVMELLEDASEDKQFVVFSTSKQVVYLLAARLQRAGITHGLLTGDTPQRERGDLIASFQAGKLRVFVGTVDTGGEGITLTAASTIIFIDRAWSPSLNEQAEDRLHRIGQPNAVQVIDIVARNTVDLGRLQRIVEKWSWIRQILGDKVTVQSMLHDTTDKET